MNTGNLFESLPETMSEEIFTEIISGKNIRIERIISKGHTSPISGWHVQDENEWVVVLKGEATLSFEDGSNKHLSVGSHINIPANTKHRVTWTKPNTETIWLAIHYRNL